MARPTMHPCRRPRRSSAPARVFTVSRYFHSTTRGTRTSQTAPSIPNSANLIAGMGLTTSLHPDFGTVWNGAPNGIPYIVVAGNQTPVPISFTAFGSQSDPGPYPVPPNAPVEGGSSGTGDRHVLVID